jgi:Tol biopolymer transport system component
MLERTAGGPTRERPAPRRLHRVAAGLLAVQLISGCGEPMAPVSVSLAGAPLGAPGGFLESDDAPRVQLHGQIFFTRAGGAYGDETIFTANADGSDQRQLTSPSADCCPAVSPDGTRIMVMTEDQLPGEPLTGGTIQLSDLAFKRLPLTDPTLNLIPQAWSPDGSRIAFEGWDDSDPSRTGVYTARFADGGDVTRLSSVTDVHDIPADYSPDGSMVVYFRSGSPDPAPWDIGGSLWIAKTDGTGVRRLPITETSPNWWARWSPDGKSILFASARLEAPGALWTIRPDGSKIRKIFEDAGARSPITPTWSPDGSQIMFALDPIADEFQHPANDVYVIRANGTGMTKVIGGDDFKRRFEWVAEQCCG